MQFQNGNHIKLKYESTTWTLTWVQVTVAQLKLPHKAFYFSNKKPGQRTFSKQYDIEQSYVSTNSKFIVYSIVQFMFYVSVR